MVTARCPPLDYSLASRLGQSRPGQQQHTTAIMGVTGNSVLTSRTATPRQDTARFARWGSAPIHALNCARSRKDGSRKVAREARSTLPPRVSPDAWNTDQSGPRGLSCEVHRGKDQFSNGHGRVVSISIRHATGRARAIRGADRLACQHRAHETRCVVQAVVKRGRRTFAVPKPMGLAERVAARTQLPSQWMRIERSTPGSRVIVNQHK